MAVGDIEICANCGRNIKRVESAFVFNDVIVCQQCDHALRIAVKPSVEHLSTKTDKVALKSSPLAAPPPRSEFNPLKVWFVKTYPYVFIGCLVVANRTGKFTVTTILAAFVVSLLLSPFVMMGTWPRNPHKDAKP